MKRLIERLKALFDKLFHRHRKPKAIAVDELPDDFPGWDAVRWVDTRGSTPVGSFKITVKLINVVAGRSTIRWGYDPAHSEDTRGWTADPRMDYTRSNIGGIWQVDGKWYGTVGEWVVTGQHVQTWTTFKSRRSHKGKPQCFFKKPMQDHRPTPGQVYYIFTCNTNWQGLHRGNERSQLVRITAP